MLNCTFFEYLFKKIHDICKRHIESASASLQTLQQSFILSNAHIVNPKKLHLSIRQPENLFKANIFTRKSACISSVIVENNQRNELSAQAVNISRNKK